LSSHLCNLGLPHYSFPSGFPIIFFP
jgi:hypothetical protein